MPHPLATAYVTDGTKSIPLNALSPDAWTPVDEIDAASGTTGARLTTRRAQALVPILYRAIDIRAKAVSRLPFRIERGGQDVTEASADLVATLRALLYLTEAAVCLTYQAYWQFGTNRLGRNLTPFWLAPQTIRPNIDQTATTPEKALVNFYRVGGGGVPLQPKEVCYFWGPSASIEIGPDPLLAPAAVVLRAAGLLHDLDSYAIGFFQRGGIKMTLLSVEGNPPKEERDKLKAWWDRMSSGVRSAWRSIVVSAAVKPTVIGSPPNEVAAPALTKISREDIATGMGVPMALLMLSAPLAGGTADAERLNFYDFTIVPEVEWMFGIINTQYLARLDMKIVAEPEKLEVYQWAGTQKAKAIAALTTLAPGQIILSLDEIRHLIGYGPLETQAEPDATLPDSTEAVDQGAEQQDMVKWQRKARERLKAGKSLDFAFESAAISAERSAAIRSALATATDEASIKAAFQEQPLCHIA